MGLVCLLSNQTSDHIRLLNAVSGVWGFLMYNSSCRSAMPTINTTEQRYRLYQNRSIDPTPLLVPKTPRHPASTFSLLVKIPPAENPRCSAAPVAADILVTLNIDVSELAFSPPEVVVCFVLDLRC